MDRFIPTCEHGAVYNNDFKGFIDYQFIRKLNQVSLTDMGKGSNIQFVDLEMAQKLKPANLLIVLRF